MKKKAILKSAAVSLVTCLLASLNLGCADSSVDYRFGDTETESGLEVNSSSLEQFADAGNWKETLRVTKENGDTVEINIDADITVPDVKQMSVVEVKEVEFDSSYRENLAKAFFGEGEVYYHDENQRPKEAWEYIMEKDIVSREQFDNLQAEDIEEIKKEYENYIQNAPDDYTPVTDYEEESHLNLNNGGYYNEYMGYRDEIPYILTVSKLTANMTLAQEIEIEPQDVALVCPTALKGERNALNCQEADEDSSGLSNECSLTEEEAEKLAQDFLNQVSCSDFTSRTVSPLYWSALDRDRKKVECINGYVFHFKPGMQDGSLLAYGSELDYANSPEWTEETVESCVCSMQSEAYIYVSDSGIVQADIQNPVIITKTTQNVKLLPLETIQNIMREELKKDIDRFQFIEEGTGTAMYLNDMELIYFRMTDRENKGYYTYVPAWRLVTKKHSFEDMMQNPVLVNAMDGSVIYFLDELAAY